MIVRNEAPIIRRCLESVKPYIDCWVILDTGSVDATPQLIEEILGDIPGELHHDEFVDFADARNFALALAHGKADYALIIDADMTLEARKGDFREGLDKDGYSVLINETPQHADLRLLRQACAWQFHGRVFEFPVSTNADQIGRHPDILLQHHCDGSSRPDRPLRDRQWLEESLQQNPEDSHALIHLGRLAQADNDLYAAADYYHRLLACEHCWDEEWRWYASYQSALIMEQQDEPVADVIAALEDAYRIRPARAEPLFHIARLRRREGDIALADVFASKAMAISLPADSFELEQQIYQWDLPAEKSLLAWRLGQAEEAVAAANIALKQSTASRNARDALMASRQRCMEGINAYRVVDPIPEIRNRFRIVVPFRNAGEHLAGCIESLSCQDYDNFDATFIDDCSDDGSGDRVPTSDPRFSLVRNTERMGPLVNRTQFIVGCDPMDIVVYVDGDDQLASVDALTYLNETYNRFDCWLTYGQFISQKGRMGHAAPYANEKQFGEVMYENTMRFPIHPITHRAALMHHLHLMDPNWNSFRDDEGKWFFYASDAVMARPLFHLAGWSRTIYIDRVLYLYTQGHEISESIHNHRDQIETCRQAGTRFRPPRLEAL